MSVNAMDTHATVQAWFGLSRDALDRVFSAAAATRAPMGEMRGVVVLPGSAFARIVAGAVSALVWQGKTFGWASTTRGEGAVVNSVSPLRVHAVRGRVYRGASWLDGKEAFVIDYSKTSLLARKVRDEIRETEPGVFLGKVWFGRTRLFDFALIKK